MKKSIYKGFSLIELLVVMGIIAVLAALVTYNFNSARARARDLQRKSDAKAIQQALELYKNDHNQSFPVTDFSTLMTTLVNADYIKKAFEDPKESLKTGSWGNYQYSAFGQTYNLIICLENKTDPDKDLAGNCGPAGVGVTKTYTQP